MSKPHSRSGVLRFPQAPLLYRQFSCIIRGMEKEQLMREYHAMEKALTKTIELRDKAQAERDEMARRLIISGPGTRAQQMLSNMLDRVIKERNELQDHLVIAQRTIEVLSVNLKKYDNCYCTGITHGGELALNHETL